MRLFLAKARLRVMKSENGEGMLARVSEAREMLPSLRPVSTFQIYLLNCNNLPTIPEYTLNISQTKALYIWLGILSSFKYHNLLGRKQNLLRIRQWYLHRRLLQDRSSPVGPSPPQWNQTPSNSGSGLSPSQLCYLRGNPAQQKRRNPKK